MDDKLQSETFVEGSISFNYDGFLRRQAMTDVSGTTTYSYDQRNRMVAKHSSEGTFTYGYDNHGNLTSTASSNTSGTNVSYNYDALNRLTTVTDTHRGVNTTTYGYDPFGNLSTVNKPNGESVTYAYDTLNRLTGMAATVGGNATASYAYTLGPTGNRTTVAELSGRNVQYTYDDLYRLTSETISNDPVTQNIGAINYTYDAVGNRQMRSSGITAISTQNFTGQYDPDDRLTAGYTYDGDGNTLQDPAGNTYQYDSLDRMTQATVNGNTSTYTYDGDGNKVQEISNSGTRMFLVDGNNPTSYAQVLEVLQVSGVSKVYTYGASRISEDQLISSNWTLDFYGYDGQGSVRYLTDINGTVVNPYEYDAFGNTIYQNNTVPNAMLFDGEEQSPNSGFYNLRVRWMNPGIGRFQSMDSFEGYIKNPLSLQKYSFGSNNPVNRIDPSGNQDLISSLGMLAILGIMSPVISSCAPSDTENGFSGPAATILSGSFKGGFTVNSYLANGARWGPLAQPGVAGSESTAAGSEFKIQIYAPYSGPHTVGVTQTITPNNANAQLMGAVNSYIGNFGAANIKNGQTVTEPILAASPFGNTNWFPLYTNSEVTFADAPGSFGFGAKGDIDFTTTFLDANPRDAHTKSGVSWTLHVDYTASAFAPLRVTQGAQFY